MTINKKIIFVWFAGVGLFIVSSFLKEPPIKSLGEWFVSLGFYLFFFQWVASFLLGYKMIIPYGGENLVAGVNTVMRVIIFIFSVSVCFVILWK